MGAGGAGKSQPVVPPPPPTATIGSFHVDTTQHGTHYVGSTRGRSPTRAGGSSYMVVSSDRSLSAQRAATAVYGNYAGSVVSSSRPNSLPPSQAGSFHYPAQPLASVSRNNSFHYT